MSLAERNGWDQEPGWAGGVGDVNSTERGSGARYNTGKAPMHLIPVDLVGRSYSGCEDHSPDQQKASDALQCLGAWQRTGALGPLFDALALLGLNEGWEECARVFDYGRKKYAEWNWAKGMKWSIPLACATRHLMAILRGEDTDPESGLPHRGHVFCNVVMLLTFIDTYPEGDDRPRCLEPAA